MSRIKCINVMSDCKNDPESAMVEVPGGGGTTNMDKPEKNALSARCSGRRTRGGAVRMLRLLERNVKREGARDGTVYGRSRTAAKGFTSHWLRLISASIATSVGDSISLWADITARSLLDAPDVTAATA